jgi:hypothetical protein
VNYLVVSEIVFQHGGQFSRCRLGPILRLPDHLPPVSPVHCGGVLQSATIISVNVRRKTSPESQGLGYDAGQGSYFGRMPPEVVENLLWFFTEPGQVVFDPFASGGTTIDLVCWLPVSFVPQRSPRPPAGFKASARIGSR